MNWDVIFSGVIGGIIGSGVTIYTNGKLIKSNKENITLKIVNEEKFKLYNELYSSLYELRLSMNKLWDEIDTNELKNYNLKLFNARIQLSKSILILSENEYNSLEKVFIGLEEFGNNKEGLYKLGRNEHIRNLTPVGKEHMTRMYIEQNGEVRTRYLNYLEKLKKRFKGELGLSKSKLENND